LSGCGNARVAIVLSCHLWPQIKTAELMFNADTRANWSITNCVRSVAVSEVWRPSHQWCITLHCLLFCACLSLACD